MANKIQIGKLQSDILNGLIELDLKEIQLKRNVDKSPKSLQAYVNLMIYYTNKNKLENALIRQGYEQINPTLIKKAYRSLSSLEKKGFVKISRKGRTITNITITRKFYNYYKNQYKKHKVDNLSTM